MSDKLPISAIVITKNEAHNIERCLTSVSFCAQIVVLDSGSTDGTRAIAEAMGAEVSLSDDWPGFGPQKNRALALANQPWVLSIDADEWVEPDLAGAIARHLTSEQPAEILRASSFCGRVMKYSGWGDDWVLRLFPRAAATFSDDLVHERVVVPGEPVRLAGVMGHESFTDLSQVLAKIDHYSGAWAEQAHARGRTASIGLAILKGFAAFLKTLLLKQGWRDGVHGWFLAATNGHGTFYKYAKLWLRAQ